MNKCPGIAALMMVFCAQGFAQVDWDVTEGPVFGTEQDPATPDIYGPMVIKAAPGYKMWYTRRNGDTTENIGYAVSADGVTWELGDSLAMLPATDGTRFDSKKKLGQPAVVQDGDTLRMWYWGNGPQIGNIGYAWSLDGEEWTKVDGAGTGKSVYDRTMDGSAALALTTPTVVKDGSTYRMWYSRLTLAGSAFHFAIGYATSPDGRAWTNVAGPAAGGNMLGSGASGKFDSHGTAFPSVVKDGDGFHMFYVGYDDLDSSRIGYATSPDGLAWTKVEGKGPMGSLLEGGSPSVIKSGPGFMMWFTGKDGVYLATSGLGTGVLPGKPAYAGGNRLHPVGSAMDISYSVSGRGFVSLAVFDSRGRKVRTLVGEFQSPGSHSVRLDAKSLSQGLYFCRLKVGGGFSQTLKMPVP
ncbi:MAG: laminin 2 [Fibrobacteres bacterium]|nr:laminin 2 [Fibrobacterota bacterium]